MKQFVAYMMTLSMILFYRHAFTDTGDSFTSLKLSETPVLSKKKSASFYSGTDTVLIVRVSFSDKSYSLPDSVLKSANDSANAWFREMSSGTFGYAFEIYPEIITLSGTGKEYLADHRKFSDDIEERVGQQGYTRKSGAARDGDFDFLDIIFPHIDNLGWGGLAWSTRSVLMNGSYNAWKVMHEFGHNRGFVHMHMVVAGDEIIGVPGDTANHDHCGNPFDVMGWGHGHTSASNKESVYWLSKRNNYIDKSGIFRIYAHDRPGNRDSLCSIRVTSADSLYSYVFEYRTAFPVADQGVIVLFQGYFGYEQADQLHLLDMTPGEQREDNAYDVVLTTGETFTDPYGTTTFKTLAVDPAAGWVDLQVIIPETGVASYRYQPIISMPQHHGHSSFFDILGRQTDRTLSGSSRVLIQIIPDGRLQESGVLRLHLPSDGRTFSRD